jgi:hypothetical protein
MQNVITELILPQGGRIGAEMFVQHPHGQVVVDSLAPARLALWAALCAVSPEAAPPPVVCRVRPQSSLRASNSAYRRIASYGCS